MTTPSHTELAARLRARAEIHKTLPFPSANDKITAIELEECAAALESPERVQPKRCGYCDDTGDVHSTDGEWRGRCTCPAGQSTPPTAPAQDAQGDAVRTQLEWFALAAHWYINASDRELAEQGQARGDALKQVHLLSGHLEASGFKFATPSPQAEKQPLSDDWIRSMCKQGWVFDTVKQWVRVTEAAHGIGVAK